MPAKRTQSVPPLDQRIGAALLRGRGEWGVIAVEDGAVVACSPEAAGLLACAVDAVEGAALEDFLSQLDDELLELRFRSALRDEAPVEFVAQRPRQPDQWIKVRSLPLRPGVAFFVKDATGRELSDRGLRRKEQRLLAANRSLRMAHAAAHAASWEWRPGRGLRWLDLAGARELECLPPAWTEDEAVADWRGVMPPGGRRAADRAMLSLADDGETSFEIEVLGADGKRHWIRIDCAVTERDLGGAPACINGVTVDVTPARRADESLREEVEVRKRSEERQQLLVHELNHRVKNMLATVQSIARRSLGAPEMSEPAQEFQERLMALAWAYEILTREQWSGASMREVIARTMAPHAGQASARVLIEGPDLRLTPNLALAWALAIHELATNAVKYGALSNDTGRIEVRWRLRDVGEDGEGQPRMLDLEWAENGGPPVAPPRRRGFGSRLIERSLARELNGEVVLDFEPSGLVCRVVAPLPEESD